MTAAREIDDMEDVIDDLIMQRKSGREIARTLFRLGFRRHSESKEE